MKARAFLLGVGCLLILVIGGFAAWKEAGFPVAERGSKKRPA